MPGQLIHTQRTALMRFYATIIASFFCISFIQAQSKPVAIAPIKIEVASYSNGNVEETFDHESLGEYLESSLHHMVRNLNPKDILIAEMNVMYLLNRGWRLMAQGTIDDNHFLFSRELLMHNDKLYWNETGNDEICLSSCNRMQFIAPRDGGCICLSDEDKTQYFMRNSAR